MGQPAYQSADIPTKWRKIAEERCEKLGARLTPARLAAYAELIACGKAVSAYDLVARLERRQNRKIAPLTAYRHLDFLISVGLVHKLESAQSYLPCIKPGHKHVSQYLLCSSCGNVDELESEQLGALLRQLTNKRKFRPEHSMVEITGLCERCVSNGSTAPD